jgi:hypothetical protein
MKGCVIHSATTLIYPIFFSPADNYMAKFQINTIDSAKHNPFLSVIARLIAKRHKFACV